MNEHIKTMIKSEDKFYSSKADAINGSVNLIVSPTGMSVGISVVVRRRGRGPKISTCLYVTSVVDVDYFPSKFNFLP